MLPVSDFCSDSLKTPLTTRMPAGDKLEQSTSSQDTNKVTIESPSSVKATNAKPDAHDPDSHADKIVISSTTANRPSSPPADPAKKQNSDTEVETSSPDQDEIINMSIFNQILELDEDDTHDFSREMVEEYYTQAAQTFDDMDAALMQKDLEKLSDLGHFLKGSSATLGVTHVQSSCEKIQRYGQLRDEEKGIDIDNEQALNLITQLITQVKGEYYVAEKWMRKWYTEHNE
ncbi:histidine-phosphotransfer domain HPT domain-containing protein [Lentinula detonsa]|uniref:Histidine-phosphotransfer domain HPT domain-containing protein n=1 Tax=Lentinula detonsa TaxID=2804962 RepID=A0A9W8P4V2_9AGAR|nr:histidine-phosphotransfer domain HPT domain-containing protein [Lentinula detonsa]